MTELWIIGLAYWFGIFIRLLLAWGHKSYGQGSKLSWDKVYSITGLIGFLIPFGIQALQMLIQIDIAVFLTYANMNGTDGIFSAFLAGVAFEEIIIRFWKYIEEYRYKH